MKNITALVILGLFLASCAPTPVTSTPAPSTSTPAASTPTPAPSTSTPAPSTATPGGATQTPAPPPASIQHVFVIMMENHGYSQVWNTSSTPYITSLGNQYVRATNYHAATHPSLPNYLQFIGGDNFGITTDCLPSDSCHVSATNLADNLEAKGLSWKAYMEGMPAPCHLSASDNYAPRHNPFIYFDDIRNNLLRCGLHDVPYTVLPTDLTLAATTPNYVFISPDVCNDMHDCSIATGDAWLKTNVPPILNSPACTVDKCLLILTWDEDDHSEGNQVLTIFAGSAAKTGGATSNAAYSHFSTLRTVEDIFGLPTQTANDAEAMPMLDMLK